MSRFDRNKPSEGEDPFASIPDVDERLADWVDGTMNERDRSRFEAEFRVSPHAREQVDEYEKTVATIREALGAKTHESNLADRVMMSIEQEAAGGGPRSRSRLSLVWASMSAAALLGVAVLINVWGGAMQAPGSQERSFSVATDEAVVGKLQGDQPADKLSIDPDVTFDSSDLVPEMSLETQATLVDRPAKRGAEKSKLAQPIGLSEVPEVASTESGARVGAGQVRPATTSVEGETSAAAGSASPETSVPTTGRDGAPLRYGGRSSRSSDSVARGMGASKIAPSGAAPDTESVSVTEIERAPGDAGNPGVVGVVSEAGATAPAGEYLYRLAAPKQAGDVLPLVTIDGFAVASDPTKNQPDDQQRAGSVSNEQSLGEESAADKFSFAEFFESQMLPAAEWQQRAPKKSVAETDPTRSSRGWQELSLGKLQAFAVGPRFDLKQQVVAEARSAKNTAEEPTGVVARPGARQAQGADISERDWLVVGPQSEVAELLASLRDYSDSIRSAWKSGEVRIIIDNPSGKDPAASAGVDSKSGTGRSDTALALKSRKPTQTTAPQSSAPQVSPPQAPVQRVVLRFRVRR